MSLTILGESERHLFLYKPPGIPVFPPHADPAGDCLLARVRAALGPRAGFPPGFEAGIAHRLDTATEGVVVAARRPDDLPALRVLFSSGRLAKHYAFHTHGDAADCVVTADIAHHPNRRDRMVVRRGPRTAHRGRWYPAHSEFRRRSESGWWDCVITTGVMHQVRAHAASVGLALTGDAKYGGSEGVFALIAVGIVAPDWASPDWWAGPAMSRS